MTFKKFHPHCYSFLLLFTMQNLVSAAEATYHYTLSWEAPSTHEYQISLTTEPEAGEFTRFRLPAWRPGRYILQDFAAGVTFFAAEDTQGQALTWVKTSSHEWRVQNPARGPITIRYRFYANILDAGSSLLNDDQAYFNGINLFMHVADRCDVPCTLVVPSMPAGWKAATALRRKEGLHNVFHADSYHQMVDSPTILSPALLTLHTKVENVDYYLHFQGRFTGGEEVREQLLSNLNRIIREQSALFGGVPFEEYHFIFQLVPYRASHAVEHAYSSMYMRHDELFSSVEKVNSVNGVIAHEFFHLWNVKRIRPAAMWPYDYQKEAYTGLHWFTEGVTSYYADLTLVRAGLLAQSSYLGNLSRSITQLENDYAASVISPYYASYDSWLARSDYANPLHHIYYYSLGYRLGLLLDLELRRQTKGGKSLDDVFRYLYQNYYLQGKGVPEDGVQLACEAVAGCTFAPFFARYVEGVADIDYAALLNPMGLQIECLPNEKGGLAHLGIARTQEFNDFLEVRAVVPDSDASRAGLTDGMIILSINDQNPKEFSAGTFFSEGQVGKTLHLKVYGHEQQRTLTVSFSGRDTQYTYRITKMGRTDAQQERMLSDWLQTKTI